MHLFHQTADLEDTQCPPEHVQLNFVDANTGAGKSAVLDEAGYRELLKGIRRTRPAMEWHSAVRVLHGFRTGKGSIELFPDMFLVCLVRHPSKKARRVVLDAVDSELRVHKAARVIGFACDDGVVWTVAPGDKAVQGWTQ